MSVLTAKEALQANGSLRPDTVAARVTFGTAVTRTSGGVEEKTFENRSSRIFDLHTPLPEGWIQADPVAAGSADALAIIRHSSAHVMADAVQKLFPGTKVAFGPAVENGFYYDYDRPSGKFSDEDLRAIEAKMREIIATDAPFRREVVTPDEARAALPPGETYKLEHLDKLAAAGASISLYRHGDWVDLCEGPHVPSTKFLQAFQLTTVAGAYWRGDERNPMLQRIYGTAFADPKSLRVYLQQLEEAKKRDHRKLGKELGLIAFHELAPASPFFLPRGAFVYNALCDYVRELYVHHGYTEVVTPQIFDRKLFETSGHLPTYAENMYLAITLDSVEETAAELAKGTDLDAKAIEKLIWDRTRFGVKPMNCPGHCLYFGVDLRSYRDLPMRIADFGRLHRYERSGVTQGLTRVRTFAQDDGHIFCTEAQMAGEIEGFFQLVFDVYRDFGFTDVKIAIATRPENRIGSDESWEHAEQALIGAAKARSIPYEIAEGEGAFYGPKIEFHLKDAIGRSWQLGTMQVDPNMPARFGLEYVEKDNTRVRPMMLHRAILGSIERFFGVLVEHVGGAFPAWLAPEQIAIVTVHETFDAYANEVLLAMKAKGIRAIVDLGSDKLGAKIKAARNQRIPYIAVVGEKEVTARTLSVRSRDENKELGAIPLDEMIARLQIESLPPSRRPKS